MYSLKKVIMISAAAAIILPTSVLCINRCRFGKWTLSNPLKSSVEANEVKANEVKANEVKANEVKAKKAKAKKVKFTEAK